MGQNEIKIDDKKIQRLKQKIILVERQNLKTREKNPSKMVELIQKMIEEEVKCISNQ